MCPDVSCVCSVVSWPILSFVSLPPVSPVWTILVYIPCPAFAPRIYHLEPKLTSPEPQIEPPESRSGPKWDSRGPIRAPRRAQVTALRTPRVPQAPEGS